MNSKHIGEMTTEERSVYEKAMRLERMAWRRGTDRWVAVAGRIHNKYRGPRPAFLRTIGGAS